MKVRLTILVATVLLSGSIAFAQEKKVREADVPKAVLDAFRSAYPNATVKGYAQEKEEGSLFFEIESQDGATRRDLLYRTDGTLAEVEETIAVSDLPTSAQVTITAKKATVRRAERVTKDGHVSYEVAGLQGKKRVTFIFDAEGNQVKH
ncbi:MAG TPA: hypothetical protein VI306_03085 [Pyrinomonadaceae bacterium]